MEEQCNLKAAIRAICNILFACDSSIVPSAAPEDVAVDGMNNTMVKVKWDHVHKDKLNGHLGGYRVIPCQHVFCFLAMI